MPDLPTFAEQGLPGYKLTNNYRLFAPAGTPRPILDRMNAEINKIIQTPEGRESMLKFGLLATGSTPDELTEVIRRDMPIWGDVIKKGNIKAQ
jgi:tripartite-type tricarboxylate transporter receptor subunit TctC